MRTGRWGAAAVAAGIVAAGLGGSAAARTAPPRLDLSVALGTAALKDGVVDGTVRIKASGARAAKSSAALVARDTAAGRQTVIASFGVPRLARGAKHKLSLKRVGVPATLPVGSYAVQVCVDVAAKLKERSESNNCVTVGKLKVVAPDGPGGPGGPTGPGATTTTTTTTPPSTTTTTTTPPTTSTTPTGPPGTVAFPPPPQHPVAPLTADESRTRVNGVNEAAAGTYAPYAVSRGLTSYSDYWFRVPKSYKRTDDVPMRLLVWLHGCGGDAEGDAYEASPDISGDDDRPYVVLSLGGTDGGCWDPVAQHEDWVLAAVNDIEKHLNIDRRKVIIAGYSSGGDLGYRTIFDHADWFAGAMIENSAPFSQNGASDDHAAYRFPVDHLAHNQDTTYPFDSEVKAGLDKMAADGWTNIHLIRRDGYHSDEEYPASADPDCIRQDPAHPECKDKPNDPDAATTGIDHDLRKFLLPLVATSAQPGGAAGWQAPLSPVTTAG